MMTSSQWKKTCWNSWDGRFSSSLLIISWDTSNAKVSCLLMIECALVWDHISILRKISRTTVKSSPRWCLRSSNSFNMIFLPWLVPLSWQAVKCVNFKKLGPMSSTICLAIDSDTLNSRTVWSTSVAFMMTYLARWPLHSNLRQSARLNPFKRLSSVLNKLQSARRRSLVQTWTAWTNLKSKQLRRKYQSQSPGCSPPLITVKTRPLISLWLTKPPGLQTQWWRQQSLQLFPATTTRSSQRSQVTTNRTKNETHRAKEHVASKEAWQKMNFRQIRKAQQKRADS